MLRKLAQNEPLHLRLQGWLGVGVGLALGAGMATLWVLKVGLVPSVIAGHTNGLEVGLLPTTLGFIAIGLVWGVLFRVEAGFSWLPGLGLAFGLVVGTVIGLDVVQGWALDWQSSVRPYVPQKLLTKVGPLGGVIIALAWALVEGLLTLIWTLAANLVGAFMLRPLLIRARSRLAPKHS